MSMKPFIVAICLVICLLEVEGADPTKSPGKLLKCYNCRNCENITLATAGQSPCGAGIKSCFKFFHSDKKVERGCSPKSGECPADTGNKVGGFTYCYTCPTELCNSGPLTRCQVLPLIAALSLFTAGICRMKF